MWLACADIQLLHGDYEHSVAAWDRFCGGRANSLRQIYNNLSIRYDKYLTKIHPNFASVNENV